MKKPDKREYFWPSVFAVLHQFVFWIPRKIGNFIFNYFVTFSPVTAKRGLMGAFILMVLGTIPVLLMEAEFIKDIGVIDTLRSVRIIIYSVALTCSIVMILKLIVSTKAYGEIIMRRNRTLPKDEEGHALWDVAFWPERGPGVIRMTIRNEALLQEAEKRGELTFEVEEAVCNRDHAYALLKLEEESLVCALPLGYIMDKKQFTLKVNDVETFERRDGKTGYHAFCKMISAEV